MCVQPMANLNLSNVALTDSYRALIFDCDGTLANTLPVHYRSMADTLAQVGVSLTEDWFYKYCGLSALEMIAFLNQEFGYGLDPAWVNATRKSLFHERLQWVEEILPVTDIVRANAGKVPMAVASGGDRTIVNATLRHLKLSNYFQTIVTVNDVAQGKPAPDLFLLAAQKLQVKPTDCLIYEDSESGLEAAQRAGIRCIDVRTLQRLEAG